MDEDVQSLLQTHRHRQAFERLLDLFELKLFRMAITYLTGQGRAEEVTQDIFLKLWQVLPAYDGRAAPPPGSIRSPETRAARRFAPRPTGERFHSIRSQNRSRPGLQR